ncbi:response regulator transcription factor [Methylocapsa acidiphila]|uniref:response regulator transcription factor n=1 Tax=Methylocapsa acidiphila TaxID=133552 RepID=UPI000408699B|nr:helix-turn-helix domain-containing protein [Methylocapsa acidiphila]
MTRRQIETLQWVAEGKSTEDIAIILNISPETVKKQIEAAREKLNAVNRAHAVAKAIRAGFIQ